MVTAADGASAHYSLDNNAARTEGVEAAIEVIEYFLIYTKNTIARIWFKFNFDLYVNSWIKEPNERGLAMNGILSCTFLLILIVFLILCIWLKDILSYNVNIVILNQTRIS